MQTTTGEQATAALNYYIINEVSNLVHVQCYIYAIYMYMYMHVIYNGPTVQSSQGQKQATKPNHYPLPNDYNDYLIC